MSFQAVLASEDLKRHIYSFGYPGHRQHMRNLCKELTHQTVSANGFELLTRVPYQWFKQSVQDKACESIMNELKWFYVLNRCRCCSRHSHHKPTIIHDPPHGLLFLEGEEGRVPEDKNLRDCNCLCRRTMRIGLDYFIHTRNL